jgi:hypothetical protein
MSENLRETERATPMGEEKRRGREEWGGLTKDRVR